MSWIAAAREAELREYRGEAGSVAIGGVFMARAGVRRGLKVDRDSKYGLRGLQADDKRVLQVAIGGGVEMAAVLQEEGWDGSTWRH